MSRMFDTLRDRLAKHAAYARTVQELRAMPLDVALDLDLDRADAEKLAAAAVYDRRQPLLERRAS